MGLLDGDTALVTGAASGIGRGIARALASEGARLVLSDISAEPGHALARELDATFIVADLTEPAAARELFDAALATLGQISIFVHSASPRRSEEQTILAVTEPEWDAMLTVGLRAGFAEAARTSNRPVDELAQERAKNSPAGRVGDPAEFGDACAFLCSAKIGFIVGHNLILDGGNFNSSIA